MKESTRNLSQTWIYARRKEFEEQLRKAASQWFSSRGYPVSPRMPYCLANHDEWGKNIIELAVVELIQAAIDRRRKASSPFPLHKYVHHGLSSQALLFNLIGPLVVRDDFGPLSEAMAQIGLLWPGLNSKAVFEFEDPSVFNEQQVQPTSIDLVLENPGNRGGLFIECKLVEKGFGGCSLFTEGDCEGMNPAHDFDCCYLHRIDRRYLTIMERHGLFKDNIANDSLCPLANHYQFYRELLLAVEKGGFFVLLADERSPVFRRIENDIERGLWPYLTRIIPESLRSRMAFLSVQRVVRDIERTGRHQWIAEFKVKYAL